MTLKPYSNFLLGLLLTGAVSMGVQAGEVECSDHELMGNQLDAFLRAVPRDAPHAGVSLDENGTPDPEIIHRGVPDKVYLQFPLEDFHE